MKLPLFPELLALLDIKGCLVSIDAMGARPRSPRPSFSKVAITYWPSKANPTQKLFEAVRQAPRLLAANPPLCAETMTLEKAGGRIDGREYHVMAAGECRRPVSRGWKQRQHWRGHLLSR